MAGAKVLNYQSRTTPQTSGPDSVAQQWSANPYANFDYRHTWWQKLIEGLGFRSQFDEYRDSMALNANEYEAQLLEKAHNESYDSAAAQAQRMRQAGLNPDLQNVDAGGSSAMEPDPNAPISPGHADVAGILEGFTNTVLSCFTGAVGLAKDFVSLAAMQNDVEAGRISNSQGIMDYAQFMAANMIPEQYPEGDSDWVNRASDQAFEVGSHALNSRQRRQFRQALNSFYQSAPTQAEQWKSWRESMQNKQSWFVESGSKFWQDGSDEILRVVTDNLSKAYDRIREKGLSVEGQSLENQETYLQGIDPSLQAGVENTTNSRNIHSADIDSILNECLDSIVRDLRDTSESGKRGHGLAQAALLLFSLLRMVNFSKSTGIQGGKSTSMTSFGF